MRPTFIDEKTKDYNITDDYAHSANDPNKGFRSKLPRSILNKILLLESEEIEFIKLAADEIKPGSIVLDAGAGQCRYKKAFSHTKYVGVDLAIGDVAWDYSQLDINANLMNLPIKSNSIDAIICVQVLEHIPEPSEFLIELCRVLKDSGKLFLSVPQGYGEHQMPYDFFRFSAPGLEYLFKKASYDINFIRPMGGYFYFIGTWLKLVPNLVIGNITSTTFSRLCQFPLKIIFEYIIPYLCFYLDRLDKGKGITVLYGCYATKHSRKESRNGSSA